jgi:putative membrane protein
MRLERFFGPEAQARVAQAVRNAEARSAGQIVPVVVERSARYSETRWIAAVVLAALATAVAELGRTGITAAELPFLQLAAAAVGWLLARLAPVERLLAGRRAMDEETRERALRAFHDHGLHRTAQGTGVLVFASLLERRAAVIGDHGIHARMGDAEWQRAVDLLVGGIAQGDPARGFCDAIAAVGARLAEHFPRAGAGSGNELPDALRTSTD